VDIAVLPIWCLPDFLKIKDPFDSDLCSEINQKVPKMLSKFNFKPQNCEKTKKTINLNRITMDFWLQILILVTSGVLGWSLHVNFRFWEEKNGKKILQSFSGHVKDNFYGSGQTFLHGALPGAPDC
jgi:hypothetical protein